MANGVTTDKVNLPAGESLKPVQCIGVPREVFPGEKRVATVPEVVEKLIKLGFTVAVESGAGDLANFSDEVYRAAQCRGHPSNGRRGRTPALRRNGRRAPGPPCSRGSARCPPSNA